MPTDDKISDLNALSSLDAGDLVPVVDTSGGETKYITRANLSIDLAIPPADDTHDHGSSGRNWRHYFMSGNFTVDSASWIGLGAAKGRLVFTDAATDEISISNAILKLGGKLDLNENSIDLTTGLADTKYEGFTATFTAGEGMTIGELCYFKPGDSKMWQADGDALATTTGLLAIATTTISADASGVFLLWGFIRDDGIFNYTAGDELYVSLTPGIPTATIPPAAGDFVRVVGNAITADVIMFNPSNDILERV